MGKRIRYRRYVGRRKSERGRSRIVICLVLLFTALVVYLSVLLGLRLREKAEKVRAESEFLSTVETTPIGVPQPPAGIEISKEKVTAPFLSVADHENIVLPQDASTVSTVMKSKDGQLFYRSSTLGAVPGSQNEDLPSANELISTLSADGRRVSVIFHRESTEEMDEIATRAILDMEVLQMTEIAKAGAAEILLMGFDPQTELDFSVSAAEKIRQANPTTQVGFVLPFDSTRDPESFKEKCRSAAAHFNIVALDVTSLPETQDDQENDPSQILGRIIENAELSFDKYNLRCIFRDGQKDADLLIQMLEQALLANYQFTSQSGLPGQTTQE